MLCLTQAYLAHGTTFLLLHTSLSLSFQSERARVSMADSTCKHIPFPKRWPCQMYRS